RQNILFHHNNASTYIPYSLPDALPIFSRSGSRNQSSNVFANAAFEVPGGMSAEKVRTLRVHHGATTRTKRPAATSSLRHGIGRRSEEHTSELQSRESLVCRRLLEKKET